MKKKIKILLEDDNEILGNGLGHPVYRQYLPTKKYLEILNKYSIRSTFYIDMAHYLFLKDNDSFKDFSFQAKCIEQTIKLLIQNKMDVQIHLHSQWVGAKIKDGNIFVTNKWNIGLLSSQDQRSLFNKSYNALSKLLSNYSNEIDLSSFKAGSWGLQPFDTLYDLFKEKGVKLVMGPIKGLKIDKLGVNYSSLHSDFYPYYASKKDINKIGDEKKIVILPMTPTFLSWFDFIRYFLEIKLFNKNKYRKEIDLYDVPDSIKNLKPLSGKDKLSFSFKPFKTHLKINSQKYWYLKNTFKRSYKKIASSKYNYKLLVIETHTKDFSENFDHIDKFFSYIINNYSNVEFVTASDIVSHINNNELLPLDE